jgi:chemotaxis signal transduction protein
VTDELRTSTAMSPEDLRREFDSAFARPPRPVERDQERLLGVPVARHPYALRVHDLDRLEAAGKIVPVPGRNPSVLGLAGLRGQLVPVFSLTRLLGHPRDAQPPRWFAVHGEETPVALAIETCSGFQPVARTDVSPVRDSALRARHISHTARVGENHWWIIDLDSLLKSSDLGPEEKQP